MTYTKADWESATGFQVFGSDGVWVIDGPHGLTIDLTDRGWSIEQHHTQGADPASLALWLDRESYAYSAGPQEPTPERVAAHEANGGCWIWDIGPFPYAKEIHYLREDRGCVRVRTGLPPGYDAFDEMEGAWTPIDAQGRPVRVVVGGVE